MGISCEEGYLVNQQQGAVRDNSFPWTKRKTGAVGVETNKLGQFCRWPNYTDREVNFYLKLQMLFNCKARLVFLQLLQSFGNVLNL